MKIDDILSDKYYSDLYNKTEPVIIGRRAEYNKWKKSLKSYETAKDRYSLYAAIDYPIVAARIKEHTIGIYSYNIDNPNKCFGYITSKSNMCIISNPYILIPTGYSKLELVNLMKPYLSNLEDLAYFRLKDDADKMLARLISIPNYRSLSPRELAIKATKLAYELDVSVKELCKFIE